MTTLKPYDSNEAAADIEGGRGGVHSLSLLPTIYKEGGLFVGRRKGE